jgi:hypothetical protein
MAAQPQLPPRVKVVCPFGHTTRTRQPEGAQVPCVACNQEAGRTVMITVPAGPGNRPTIRPPEPPATPAGMAQITRRRTAPHRLARALTGTLEPRPMALYLGLVPRQIWNVSCTARRTNGEPCSAWAMRGQYTCWAHGGASPQARASAEFRLWRDRFWARAAHDISRGLLEFEARLRADQDAVRAETLAQLSQLNQRLRQFKRANGHRPRSSELAGIFNSVGL